MFLRFLFLILLSNSVASQQGKNQWTTWFDTNDPDPTQGDFEVTNHIQQMFPDVMCLSPIAIEAQTSFDTNPTTTGDVFRIATKDGFLCLNQKILSYKTKICTDYKVRYCCPVTTG